jgi:hypothetical protein
MQGSLTIKPGTALVPTWIPGLKHGEEKGYHRRAASAFTLIGHILLVWAEDKEQLDMAFVDKVGGSLRGCSARNK